MATVHGPSLASHPSPFRKATNLHSVSRSRYPPQASGPTIISYPLLSANFTIRRQFIPCINPLHRHQLPSMLRQCIRRLSSTPTTAMNQQPGFVLNSSLIFLHVPSIPQPQPIRRRNCPTLLHTHFIGLNFTLRSLSQHSFSCNV
jgi:hypothetical protein